MIEAITANMATATTTSINVNPCRLPHLVKRFITLTTLNHGRSELAYHAVGRVPIQAHLYRH